MFKLAHSKSLPFLSKNAWNIGRRTLTFFGGTTLASIEEHMQEPVKRVCDVAVAAVSDQFFDSY
jgi:hypothetical protein